MIPTTVLVPFKTPGQGKSRLGPALSEAERSRLSEAMLVDVLAALRQCPVDRIVVAASDSRAARFACSNGAETVCDPPGCTSLDGALEAAAQQFDAERLLIVAADLPALGPDDVGRLLRRSEDVVVAPTWDGGTGALMRRPPSCIRTAYGPDSAKRHLELARLATASTVLIELPGFRADIDVPADLEALRSTELGARTTEVLRDLRGSHPRG